MTKGPDLTVRALPRAQTRLAQIGPNPLARETLSDRGERHMAQQVKRRENRTAAAPGPVRFCTVTSPSSSSVCSSRKASAAISASSRADSSRGRPDLPEVTGRTQQPLGENETGPLALGRTVDLDEVEDTLAPVEGVAPGGHVALGRRGGSLRCLRQAGSLKQSGDEAGRLIGGEFPCPGGSHPAARRSGEPDPRSRGPARGWR
jgi:hypothetical protein